MSDASGSESKPNSQKKKPLWPIIVTILVVVITVAALKYQRYPFESELEAMLAPSYRTAAKVEVQKTKESGIYNVSVHEKDGTKKEFRYKEPKRRKVLPWQSFYGEGRK